MPESRAFVLIAESRRSLSMLSTHSSICVPKTKLLPSALLRGESYIFSEYYLLFTIVRDNLKYLQIHINRTNILDLATLEAMVMNMLVYYYILDLIEIAAIFDLSIVLDFQH